MSSPPKKPRLRSKTNGLGAALLALALGILTIPELQALVEQLDSTPQAIALGVIGGMVILLRELTSSPVAGWLTARRERGSIELTEISVERSVEPLAGTAAPPARTSSTPEPGRDQDGRQQ